MRRKRKESERMRGREGGGGGGGKEIKLLRTDATCRVRFSKTAPRFGSNYSSKAQVASTSVNKRSKRAGRTVSAFDDVSVADS